jgi:Zn-dependent M16 (insulinase) family peptidase
VALLVAIAYFTQNEGPFHKEIRDPGYASTYSIVVRPDEGLIYFEIKNAMDLVNAYTAAYAIILEHVGQAPRKRTTLEEEQMREVVETLDLKARTISVSTPNIPERSREQDEDELWSETLLRSAKSAAIFHLVEEENTPKTLAFTSLKNHFCGVSEDYGRALMARIPTLTMAEVKRVTKAWLGPLFGDTSTCAVAAPEKNVPGIIKGMME